MDIELKQIRGKIIQIYSEQFKRRVIEEYLSTGTPKVHLLRKYGIKTKCGIQRWMKKFGYEDVLQPVKVTFTPLNISVVTGKEASNEELQKKVKELEKQLEDEKLRSEAYARMIEKAEKEFKISITKKSVTR